MMTRKPLLLASLLLSAAACGDDSFTVTWETQESHLQTSLRGLFVVSPQTAWISGTEGRYALTRDGGRSWVSGQVPGAEAMDFRDVEAFEDGTAYLMAIGAGDLSRIFKTTDWGQSWTLQHINDLEAGFYNGMAFWDKENGLVVGDPVDGDLFLLSTSDGGEEWLRMEGDGLPSTEVGEYGFAASGTNITTFGEGGVAVASGGSVARIFLSTDRGETWNASPAPILAGSTTRGVFSVAFKDAWSGVAVGGDYQAPESTDRTIALSSDGGLSWTLAPEPHGVGFRSAVAWRGDPSHPMWVAVGTSGSSYSPDDGVTWITFDTAAYNSVAFAGSAGWAAGPGGGLARLVVK